MVKLNINQVRDNISEHLKHLTKVGSIIICKRNIPIAEIRPISSNLEGKKSKKRVNIGFAKGLFKVDDKFFEPMSEEELDSFN